MLVGAGGVCVIAVSIAVSTIRYHAPPVPSTLTMHHAVIEILTALKTDVHTPDGRIYDLGAGWGGLSCAVARVFPDREIVAVEVSMIPALLCFIRAQKFKNMSVIWADVKKISVTPEDTVLTYVTAPVMKAFAAQIPKSTVWISIFFAVPGRTAKYHIQLQDLWKTRVYGYVS